MTGPQDSSKSPKAILFDIGGVILRLNLARAFEPLAEVVQAAGAGAQAAPTPEQIWDAIRGDPRWRDWQEGRLTPEQWYRHLTARLGVRVSFGDFAQAWNRALDPKPMFPDELYAKLGERARLGLLSNTDPLHVECLERHFSFMRYFPVRIYSCRERMSKPAAGIFEKALEALGVSAAEALYVDDIERFAEAARQLGMDAIHFKDAEQFAREMGARGFSLPGLSG